MAWIHRNREEASHLALDEGKLKEVLKLTLAIAKIVDPPTFKLAEIFAKIFKEREEG